jgi:transposase
MRGRERQQSSMFSYISAEQRVPKDHPLRAIRVMVDAALKELRAQLDAMYAKGGRPSIPPEKLLRALLLQLLFSVRSERQLMEQLDYNLLFRWFVGLSMDDPVWDVTVFTKNRERLLAGEIARAFFQQVVSQARAQGLISAEHFTVDGTLIEAWAGQKSFQHKQGKPTPALDDPGNPSIDFHGERRCNATHQSTTDPQSRLYKKSAGQEAKLCYMGHLLMENRNGLVVNTRLTQADGRAERRAALAMVEEMPGFQRVTLGADKGYDAKDFVRELRDHQVTPHVAQKPASAIDRRTSRRPGYSLSQWRRKRVEEVFGWLKTVAALRKTHHGGQPRVGWIFTLAAAAYNLVRMRNLTAFAT